MQIAVMRAEISDNDFYISLEYLPYMIQEYTQADPCISAYQDIVSAYTEAENCSDEERESLYPYVDTSYINRLDEVRYYLYDIDGNGTEELIFAWEYEQENIRILICTDMMGKMQ